MNTTRHTSPTSRFAPFLFILMMISFFSIAPASAQETLLFPDADEFSFTVTDGAKVLGDQNNTYVQTSPGDLGYGVASLEYGEMTKLHDIAMSFGLAGNVGSNTMSPNQTFAYTASTGIQLFELADGVGYFSRKGDTVVWLSSGEIYYKIGSADPVFLHDMSGESLEGYFIGEYFIDVITLVSGGWKTYHYDLETPENNTSFITTETLFNVTFLNDIKVKSVRYLSGGGSVEYGVFFDQGNGWKLVDPSLYSDFSGTTNIALSKDANDGLVLTLVASTIGKQIYLDGAPSSENDITSFSIPDQVGDASINTTDHTVSVTMPYYASLSFTDSEYCSISEGGSIAPTGAQDFSSPVAYTVTAEDGSTQEWTVTVSLAEAEYEVWLYAQALGQNAGWWGVEDVSTFDSETYSLDEEPIEQLKIVNTNDQSMTVTVFDQEYTIASSDEEIIDLDLNTTSIGSKTKKVDITGDFSYELDVTYQVIDTYYELDVSIETQTKTGPTIDGFYGEQGEEVEETGLKMTHNYSPKRVTYNELYIYNEDDELLGGYEGEVIITWLSGNASRDGKVVSNLYYNTNGGEDILNDEATFTGTSIQETTDVQFNLFPNPVINTMTISGIDGLVKWNVVNVNGQVVKSGEEHTNSELLIDLSDLPSGVFILNVFGDRNNGSLKIIKK